MRVVVKILVRVDSKWEAGVIAEAIYEQTKKECEGVLGYSYEVEE